MTIRNKKLKGLNNEPSYSGAVSHELIKEMENDRDSQIFSDGNDSNDDNDSGDYDSDDSYHDPSYKQPTVEHMHLDESAESIEDIPEQTDASASATAGHYSVQNVVPEPEILKLSKKRKRRRENLKLLPPCSCRLKCVEKISEINRQRVLDAFKLYSFGERRLFLDKYIKIAEVQTRTTRKPCNDLTKQKSMFYSLPKFMSADNTIRVCKIMFMHTLGSKSDGFITAYKTSFLKKGSVETIDGRGSVHNENRKITGLLVEKRIKQHIESYNPVVSHYKLQHAPHRRYLPQDITISFLHQEYNKIFINEQVSYETYRNAFKNQNIGHSIPSQDECPHCSKYKQHIASVTSQPSSTGNCNFNESMNVNESQSSSSSAAPMTSFSKEKQNRASSSTSSSTLTSLLIEDDNQLSPSTSAATMMSLLFEDDEQDETISVNVSAEKQVEVVHNPDECSICEDFKQHKIRYVTARKSYKNDSGAQWPTDHYIYTVDMQKIFIIPKMTIKNSYFVSRLVVMNETFAAIHNGNNICVLWHEAINGRCASEIASTYFNIIKNSGSEVNKFTFWADNCSAQNKNWILFSSFVLITNEDWGPETITIKYFEPGHSFMKADSVHGKIGAVWKKRLKYWI